MGLKRFKYSLRDIKAPQIELRETQTMMVVRKERKKTEAQ